MAAPRKKLWHESKYLRKRAAFLLDDVDLIPTDVSFRVGKGQNAVLIHGHKIFYALVSPVFQAMLFGSLDEQKSIVIPDVTSEAFQCPKTYAYSDSFAPVWADNVMDGRVEKIHDKLTHAILL
ncbi:hypothetical protein RvY_04801 [Ramazzottius varieornatus]|uniref:BTB domain-containing protein n=1 Tax=Ramazzottius varieornatus TaxID=947166 RepID=A0A1D1V2R1_RAMVA|nr:hypothetical protein RvY_04801 [Ramazzottius varieornatus]